MRRRSGRDSHSVRGRCIVVLVVLAACAIAVSCDVSSSLLSESEKKTIYTLSLSSDGKSVADGQAFASGAPIVASVSKVSGAQEPSTLDLAIETPDGKTVATLGLTVHAGSGLPASSVAAPSASPLAEAAPARTLVARLEGTLPTLAIPAGLKPGTYRLVAVLRDYGNAVLQRSSFVVFLEAREPAIRSVSAYPPTVEPGNALLLDAAVDAIQGREPLPADGSAAKSDPWLKWSRDGVVFSEGALSDGFDKVVWTAPKTEGIYAIDVEVFPAAPPDQGGFSFRARARQQLKAMVKASPLGPDEFADVLKFSSLLRLDGNFEDSGTRSRTVQPESFGAPPLDVFPGGFGYRLGPTAGVRLPGLMPPSADGRLGDFAVVARIAPEGGDGVIARFSSGDGQFALAMGLRQGKPYVDLVTDGKALRSTAQAAIPLDPVTLAAFFHPRGDILDIFWSAEGTRIHAPSLVAPQLPEKGSATIGGIDSLPGVYDAFGLMPGSGPPAYRIAAKRMWRSSLVVAEGFEDGLPPPDFELKGGAAAKFGAVDLPSGSRLDYRRSVDLSKHLAIEADFAGEVASARLSFWSEEGGALFSVGGSGEVRGAAGTLLGAVPVAEGRIEFELLPSPPGAGPTIVSGAIRIACPAHEGTGALFAISRDGGTGSLGLERVLVREAVRPAGSKP